MLKQVFFFLCMLVLLMSCNKKILSSNQENKARNDCTTFAFYILILQFFNRPLVLKNKNDCQKLPENVFRWESGMQTVILKRTTKRIKQMGVNIHENCVLCFAVALFMSVYPKLSSTLGRNLVSSNALR